MRTAVAVAVLAASGILPVLAVRRVDPVKIIRAKGQDHPRQGVKGLSGREGRIAAGSPR